MLRRRALRVRVGCVVAAPRRVVPHARPGHGGRCDERETQNQRIYRGQRGTDRGALEGGRVFPPCEEIHRAGQRAGSRYPQTLCHRELSRLFSGVRRPADLVGALQEGARHRQTAFLEMVRGRQAQCLLQLRGPSPRAVPQQGGVYLRGRTRRRTAARLDLPGTLCSRKRACGARIQDSGSHVLISMDAYWRAGKLLDHKVNADIAVQTAEEMNQHVDKVLIWQRFAGKYSSPTPMVQGRDFFVHDFLKKYRDQRVEPVPMNAEDPLFLMYTSGSTGKPKGCQHRTGGYLAYVAGTSKYIQDIHPTDTYWCMADIGWITGHSYIVYGPLAIAAT